MMRPTTLHTARARQTAFFFGAFFLLLGVLQPSSVFAGASESARGFAWGGGANNPAGYEGMGWISMNSLSDESGTSYGVNIPAADGNLFGYAWSEWYGWISFNSVDLAGCSPVLTGARRTGNSITGGARILAIRDAVAIGNAGGYDGCISLSGSGYGLTINTATNPASISTTNRYAWSSDLGWIDFSGVTLGAPSLPDLVAATPTVSPSSGISVGQSVSFSSSITNIGPVAISGSFPNLFRVDGSTLVAGSNITNLSAGASRNTTAAFTPTTPGAHTVSACADNTTGFAGNITESDDSLASNCSPDATFTAAACTVSLDASDNTIEEGESTTLSWSPSSSSCGFTTCTGIGFSTSGDTSGNQPVSPSVTSTFGVSCVGPYNPDPGTPPDYETITVTPPGLTFTVNGQEVATRVNPATANNTVIFWNADNVSSCTGTNFSTGGATSGTVTTTTTSQTVYSIDCLGTGGVHKIASVIVNVLPSFQTF